MFFLIAAFFFWNEMNKISTSGQISLLFLPIFNHSVFSIKFILLIKIWLRKCVCLLEWVIYMVTYIVLYNRTGLRNARLSVWPLHIKIQVTLCVYISNILIKYYLLSITYTMYTCTLYIVHCTLYIMMYMMVHHP